MNNLKITPYIIFFLMFLTSIVAQVEQLTWQGCTALKEDDFKISEVVKSSDFDGKAGRILKMAFDMDANGAVDIYFIQRKGIIKLYDGKSDTVMTIGEFSPDTDNEDGLVGIALDPSFKTNRYLFFYYSKGDAFIVSRFTMNYAQKQIDFTSEKVILRIPSERGRWHTAGAMQFDAYGDLWINVGDNESFERGPANTADMRGGILRIHPEADGSYTIPKGNLWEFASNYFDGKNMSAVASDYRDPAKMKREIYYMGTRNAYTLTLDPVRRWATYGDCGPDYGSRNATDTSEMSEEHTVVTEPGFGGWPYFAGKSYRQPKLATNYDEVNETFWGMSKDMDNPVNLNPTIKGIPQLLPMKRATHTYPRLCAMTGPIYRYDGDLQSSVKLPPHFNRLWLVTDYRGNWIRGIRLSNDGKAAIGEPLNLFTKLKDTFTTGELPWKLDFQQGPDGALYLLAMGGNAKANGIHRIEYSGACRPSTPKLETPISINPKGYNKNIQFTNAHLKIEDVAHKLRIVNLKGKIIYSQQGENARDYVFSKILSNSPKGLYIVNVSTRAGSFNYKYSKL